MPTLDQIRAAIKTTLAGVSGIGTVHDYERFAKEVAKFREFYLSGSATNQRLLGWNIRRTARSERLVDTGRHYVDNTWRIRGLMAIDDADESEKLLDNLVESARDAFIADDTLGNVVATCNTGRGEAVGLQMTDSGPVMFSGVLCHMVNCRLTTRHYT